MQYIRHAWCWRCGEKFAPLIFCDLTLVKRPADINQSADAYNREGEDQRILAFDFPHDEISSEKPLRLTAAVRRHFDEGCLESQVR
jgi:hypothetical protein